MGNARAQQHRGQSPEGAPAMSQMGSRPKPPRHGLLGSCGAAPCLGLLSAPHPQLGMCPPGSGLAVGRVGTSRMQRLEHSDRPEKEAPAGNVAAHGQPEFLPQGEARAVARAGLCIWAALLQLQVRGEGTCSGSSRQGEQAGQTYRGVNPMVFPHQERFPGVFQNVTPAPSAQPDPNTQRLWVWPPKGRWSENPVSIQSLSEVFPS